MASNIYKGFTIEHDPTVRKKINCMDCEYYLEDASCSKTTKTPGENDLWKSCDYFALSKSVPNYEEKLKQLTKLRGRSSKDVTVIAGKPKSSKINDKSSLGSFNHWSNKPYSSVSPSSTNTVKKVKAIVKK